MYTLRSAGPIPASVSIGPPFATVCRDLASLNGLADVQDGDAAFLPPGTNLLRIEGHDPRLMLAAELEGRMTVFEADDNPDATTGRDLFDFSAGLASVTILDGATETEQLGRITDPSVLADLAQKIMSAKVDHSTDTPHDDSDRWFLYLTTSDGLTVRRAFWRSNGELSRGILLDAQAASLLEGAATSAIGRSG
jgi:hypothetical protein